MLAAFLPQKPDFPIDFVLGVLEWPDKIITENFLEPGPLHRLPLA